VVAFRLPARVLEDLTLGPASESLTDLMLRVQDETGMVEIGSSLFKPGMVEEKLSKASTIVYTENEYLRKNLRINGSLSYQVSFHSEMVGVHLLGGRPAAGVAEHLLQKLQHFADSEVGRRLSSWILKTIVLPYGLYLFLQRHHPVG
jgi:hypothetical protein